jgi:hypothetical protein
MVSALRADTKDGLPADIKDVFYSSDYNSIDEPIGVAVHKAGRGKKYDCWMIGNGLIDTHLSFRRCTHHKRSQWMIKDMHNNIGLLLKIM